MMWLLLLLLVVMLRDFRLDDEVLAGVGKDIVVVGGVGREPHGLVGVADFELREHPEEVPR